MSTRVLALLVVLLASTFSGCVSPDEPVEEPQTEAKRLRAGAIVVDVAQQVESNFAVHVLPSEFPGHGLYEPTVDVGPDGAIYYSAHSQDVGRNPSPAYYSLDDGVTWQSMALFRDVQGEPDQQMGAPLFSDEVFIIATEGGQAWGADCCTRSEEHTSELQSQSNLVCRLLL